VPELGESADGFVEHNAAMVEDFLKLRRCFHCLDVRQDTLPPHKNRVKSSPHRGAFVRIEVN